MPKQYLVAQQVGAAAAGQIDTVSGPTVIQGVYQENSDTTPAGTTVRLSVHPRGGSPATPMAWTTAAGPGDVFNAANPAGRFGSWGLYIPAGSLLRLDWAGAGGGGPTFSALVEHDPSLSVYRTLGDDE